MIRKDEELPAFQPEYEMLNCRHTSQQLPIKSAITRLSTVQLPAEESQRLPDVPRALLEHTTHVMITGIYCSAKLGILEWVS